MSGQPPTYTATGDGGTQEYPLDDHRVRAIFNTFGWSSCEAPIQDMLAVADAADCAVNITRLTDEQLSRYAAGRLGRAEKKDTDQ